MEIHASFECNMPELDAIWRGGTELFLSVRQDDVSVFLHDPAALATYLHVYLLLTADVAGADALLHNAAQYLGDALTDTLGATDKSVLLSAFSFADAVLVLMRYANPSGEELRAWYGIAEALCDRAVAATGKDTPRMTAQYLGARQGLQRLAAGCGQPMNRAKSGAEVREFHSICYASRQRLYRDEGGVSPLINVLPAAYGYLCDDAEETVREYLVSHAFEVPQREYAYLYRALSNLEAYDALYPTVLEGGVPTAESGVAALAGLEALLIRLCGVDTEMLGRGIQCAQPHLPGYVAYRLILPSEGGFLLFDEGELMVPFSL